LRQRLMRPVITIHWSLLSVHRFMGAACLQPRTWQWTGYDGRNELRFMNHSDQPNAELDGLDCYALTDIQAGTEITIDYGWNDA